MRKSSVLFLAAVLSACSGAEDESPTPTATPELNAVDMRIEPPAPPEGGLQILGPDFVIGPYQDKMVCLFLQPVDEDTAVNQVLSYQSDYGHHAVLLETSLPEEEYPTGTVVDCTNPDDFPMYGLSPFLLPITDDPLEAGFAAKMPAKTRYVFQSHYVNASDQAILVRDVVNFGRVPVESVTTWVNGWSMSYQSISVPPNTTSYTRTFTCSLNNDMTLMSLIGHMHEWGSSISVVWNRSDGTTKTLYEETWEPDYRDFPPTKIYTGAMVSLKAGDTITTSCSWYNDTDQPIDFPHEMCVTSGNAYPLETSYNCNIVEE